MIENDSNRWLQVNEGLKGIQGNTKERSMREKNLNALSSNTLY